jgi:hypothetical protein
MRFNAHRAIIRYDGNIRRTVRKVMVTVCDVSRESGDDNRRDASGSAEFTKS